MNDGDGDESNLSVLVSTTSRKGYSLSATTHRAWSLAGSETEFQPYLDGPPPSYAPLSSRRNSVSTCETPSAPEKREPADKVHNRACVGPDPEFPDEAGHCRTRITSQTVDR